MVRVYFGNTIVLVSDPEEWEDFSIAVNFDHTNQVTTIKYDTDFTFVDEAFEYLYSRRYNTCELIPVLIEMEYNGSWDTIMTGVIFPSDVIYDELYCQAKVQIQDDGYSGRIENNKNSKVPLGLDTTKNGFAITAAVKRTILMFNPTVGTYTEGSIKVYDVYEAFKFLISWMTDNQVGFRSDYFSTGDGKLATLCSGITLRYSTNGDSDAEPPSMSFDGLFTVFRKLRNIALGFEKDIDGRPVVRIEHISHFRGGSVILDLNDVNQTEFSFVRELLYARVRVGSEITRPIDCNGGFDFCAAGNNISYYGFDEEAYTLTGECNKDIELDLSIGADFIVDTNTIEDVLVYGNENFDDNVFIIELDATQSAAKATDVLSNGIFWYNFAYTNREVLSRVLDYITGALNLFSFYVDINLFKAEGGPASGILLPDQTPNWQTHQPSLNVEVYDDFDRFSLVTDRFTPVDEGSYLFMVGATIDDWPTCPGGYIVFIKLNVEHYDAGGTLITKYQSPSFDHVTRLTNPLFHEWESPWINMDSGDYCIFTVDYAQNVLPSFAQTEITIGLSAQGEQYFMCKNSRVTIQDIVVAGGQDRRIAKTSATHPIYWDQQKAYLADLSQLIRMSNQRIDRTGWLSEINFRPITGECEVEILSE